MTINFVSLLSDSTTTTGTGNVTTSGSAVTGYRLLAGIGPVGAKFDYRIGAIGADEWEEGVGTLMTATSFSRSPTDSSNNNQLVNFAAGTKAVSHSLIASRMRKINERTSENMLYLSTLCKGDADISLGSTTLGTDEGAIVQAAFDRAVGKKAFQVIVDVPIGVLPQFSDIALKLHDNTILSLMPDCGFILQGGSNVALLGNYDRTDGRAGISTNGAGNKNISIIGHGGVLNGNGSSFRVLQFFGVDGFVYDGPKLFNSAHFHAHMGNIKNFTIRDMYVDKGTGGGIFGDGLHICGPASDGWVENLTVKNCGDDNFALNADDAWVGNSETYQPRGPITNITAIGIKMQSQLYGVRVLSGGSPVHNIYIGKVTGTTNGYSVVIDCFDPAQTLVSGPGAIGTITLADIDVDVSAGGDSNLKACMSINCKIDQLNLIRYKRKFFLNSPYASAAFGARCDIANLYVEAYNGSSLNNGTSVTGQFDFRSGSKVKTAKFAMSTFKAPNAVSGYPIMVQTGATINHLIGIGNDGENFTDFVGGGGTIGTNHFSSANNFMITAASTSTWVLDSGFTEVSDSAVNFSGSIASVQVARKAATDSFGGNLQLPAIFQFTGNAVTALNIGIYVRGSNTQPWNGSNRSAYVLDVNKIANQFTLQRSIGGTDTVIGSRVTVNGGIAMNTQYKAWVTPKDSTISARVQRVSDSLYLQPSGTWAATAVDCITGTDTGISANAAGLQYGLYGYAYNENGSVSGYSATGITPTAAP